MTRARITLVDFDARLARLHIEPAPPDVPARWVRRIVSVLQAIGMEEIEVCLDARTPAPAADAVRSALKGTGTDVRDGAWEGPVERRGNRVFERFGSVDPAGPPPARTYEACFDTLDAVVARSSAFVALVCATAEIESALAGRLRFAVHELVANAADHAAFVDATRIELAVVTAPASVLVSYRDSARPFPTTAPPDIDIGRKIARGERRGLGLFMLNRMAQRLRYRRIGDWNETTVLFVSTGGTAQPARRSVMDGLKLEQTPCHIPHTVVLKPVGSIDSTTVRVVDAKLSALAAQKGVQVVVDMSSVAFLSSAGVGVFLGTVSQLRANGGDLVFMGMPPAVREVFEIINLSAYFKMVASLDELEPANRR